MGVERFVEHRIELLSVKGLEQFLMKGTSQQAHNRVGKDQYADIVEITRNVLSLVLEGGISVP